MDDDKGGVTAWLMDQLEAIHASRQLKSLSSIRSGCMMLDAEPCPLFNQAEMGIECTK